MSKGRILIVEDDENLRITLEDNLDDEGYAVVAVATVRDAKKELRRGETDLVILDIMLPDGDGYGLCKEIRAEGYPVRVLMLTARTLESDLVQGFDVGADDYLAKPYRLRELLARIGALMRRGSAAEPRAVDRIAFAGFDLDIAGRRITDPQGGELSLTRTEFDLLACLAKSRDKALTREAILEAAWDPDVVVEPRTVDNFVSSLKKKLGWTKQSAFRIKTVRGVGYRMEWD